MRKVFPITILLLSIVVLTFSQSTATADGLSGVTPKEAGLSEAKLAEVDAFMEQAVADRRIAGGIVMISHNGRVGFAGTYGLRELESGKPMTRDTIFRIYSMSKAITTAAALTLHEAGKLGLDNPVSNYIPSFANLKVASPDGLRPPRRPMTVRDLMLHTAGLTYGEGPEAHAKAFAALKPLESTNLTEMVERLSRIPLAMDPGTDWTYGVATDVLGRVIEVISGQPLDVFLAETVFTPLQMTDTGFHVPPEKTDRFAANYRHSTNGLEVIDSASEGPYTKPVTLFSGGGGLVSTADDYMRFLTMIEAGGVAGEQRILRSDTVGLMTRNQLPKQAFPIHFGDEQRYGTGFGLGFSVRTEITSWDPDGRVGEYGWGGAASTHYWCSPDDRLIVVTMEQIMPYQWDTELGTKRIIYDAMVPQEGDPPREHP